MYKIFLHLVGRSNDINPTFFDRLKKQQQKTGFFREFFQMLPLEFTYTSSNAYIINLVVIIYLL